jgi:hypothetical protein
VEGEDVSTLLLATIVTVGGGVEFEHPESRLGGVAEVGVSLTPHVALQFMGRGRHFEETPDGGYLYSGGIFDAAVGVRFDLREADAAKLALPFLGGGVGFEYDEFSACSDCPTISRTYALLHFEAGVDFFLEQQPHFGVRLLFRVDTTSNETDPRRTDYGGALLLIARF